MSITLAMMRSLVLLLSFLAAVLHAAVVPLALDGGLDRYAAATIVLCHLSYSAAFVPFKEVAAGNFLGNEVSVSQDISQCIHVFLADKVQVIGNYVDGVPIAGLVSIAQYSLQASNGVIASLNVDGSLKMVGGQTLRINDPNAVYSSGLTLNPAFTADDQNPSVTAFSGFPMCVPRSANDLKCPASNRPAGTNIL